MMRVTGGAAIVALGVILSPVAASAQTPLSVNARVEISAAVAGSTATLEAIERQAASLDRTRQDEIAALQARLVQAETVGAANVARFQAELIAAREALVADLASQDRAYAEEISVFRREVTDIASTPEGAAALARYNAGDRAGAIAVLDRLRQARQAARRVRADIESAAEARQIATLALDARGKGDPAFDTGAVIARYEEVTGLDRGEYADWYQLFQLYRAAGRNADALTAAERMEALASDDRQQSIAQTFAADILLSQGDRDGALERYERSLDITERLSAADPASGDVAENLSGLLEDGALRLTALALLNASRAAPTRGAQVIEAPALTGRAWDRARELSVLLIRLGDVRFSQGDLGGALNLYVRAGEIRENLHEADRSSAERERDLGVARIKIGDVLLRQGRFNAARNAYSTSLEIFERLSAADPASADRARDVSGLLLRIGDVFLGEDDSEGALVRYQRSHDIAERLSEADPGSADLARDVSVSSNKVGDALLSQGDAEGARARYERGLGINERLSEANPDSADRARDLGVSLIKIGDVLLSQGDRAGALVRYRGGLEVFERLSVADPLSADRARDVFLTYMKMGEASGDRRYRERALEILRDLEARGALAAVDRPFIAQLDGLLASPGTPPS